MTNFKDIKSELNVLLNGLKENLLPKLKEEESLCLYKALVANACNEAIKCLVNHRNSGFQTHQDKKRAFKPYSHDVAILLQHALDSLEKLTNFCEGSSDFNPDCAPSLVNKAIHHINLALSKGDEFELPVKKQATSLPTGMKIPSNNTEWDELLITFLNYYGGSTKGMSINTFVIQVLGTLNKWENMIHYETLRSALYRSRARLVKSGIMDGSEVGIWRIK
jgi:hypothetical protein